MGESPLFAQLDQSLSEANHEQESTEPLLQSLFRHGYYANSNQADMGIDGFFGGIGLARVPEEEIVRLKAEVSLERLAEARGIALRRHGADLLGLCPFHDDHEPSLVISPAKNLWHCLGACQAGGSVIDWVMRTEAVSFRHAVELLRTDPSLAASGPVRGAKETRQRKLPAPVTTDADDSAVLRQVVDYYQQTLHESPAALKYLEQRGISDKEAVGKFQLGYANRTLGYRLPPMQTKSGGEMRGRLQQLGVIRETGHEHFNGSLVIPVINGGVVTEMYGRKITRTLNARTPLHLYLPGPHRGVWNADDLEEQKDVILCEALIDAMTFWVHGIRNVTAAYGIEGFTDDHLTTFSRCGVQRVFIAYDHDAAGDKAAVHLASKLVSEGLDVFRVIFPNGLDANAYALLELSTAGERLQRLIRKAVWLGKGASAPDKLTPLAPPALPAPAPTPTPVQHTYTQLEPAPTGRATKEIPPPPPREESAADEVQCTDDEVLLTFGERNWRARGLARIVADDSLRVNLLLRTKGEFFVDTIDLYIAKQRQGFATQAAQETGVLEETVRRDLGRVLLQLEAFIAERKKKQAQAEALPENTLSENERQTAMELLRDPELLQRVVQDFDRIGIVGEATNKLVAYLAATSRLLEQPLAVVLQSSSAAGKSSLLEATLSLFPEQCRAKYSAMTGQSLYYMAEQELAHKILAVVEEEGAERATYALKLLQSEGELNIASTGKDPQTGRLVTQEYHVQGPVALFLTTTAIDVDEELLNRCLVLSVDEEREQTQAIHQRQRERETLQGLLTDTERRQAITLHRAAQTLLRPLLVVNPYAPQLTFANQRTRTRRDHQKYLTLIRTIALLHQYQREVKRVTRNGQELEYIEVIPADIAAANEIARLVLGHSLDELPPQTRRLLFLIDQHVKREMERQSLPRSEIRMTRKELRESTGWGNSQLAVHLARLVELEYLYLWRGIRGHAHSFFYELTWDESDAITAIDGLLDTDSLTYDIQLPGLPQQLPGLGAKVPAHFRGGSGPVPGHFRDAEISQLRNADNVFPSSLVALAANSEKTTTRGDVFENAVVVEAAG